MLRARDGSQGNRGFDARVVIVDEAAFTPEQLLLESIFPQLMMYQAACLMLTTPAGSDTPFMRLVMQVDDVTGAPQMPVVWLGQPCDICQEKSQALSCKHTWYQTPHWKDPERADSLKWIYGSRADVNQRENYGLVPREHRVGFSSELIERFRRLPPFDDRNVRPSVVFLSADSAAGGESDFALAAGYAAGQNMFVLTFLDAARLDPQHLLADERTRLRTAIETIRSAPGMHGMPIVFVPENAPGMAGAHLWDYICDMGPIIVMEEYGSARAENKRIGVPKTQQLTEEMRFAFINALETNGVRFSASRFSSLRRNGEDGRAASQSKLFAQMAGYRPGIKKHYGEAHNDDLLISVMMLMVWRARFFRLERPAYAQFCQRHINAVRTM